MRYALAPKGVLQTYPYSFAQLRKDNPQVSFSADPAIAMRQAAELGVVEVAETDPPAYDPTKNVSEGDPVDSGGNWVQVWVEADASAEEIALRQKAVADDDATVAVKVDGWVKAFVAMTPVEASEYVTAHVDVDGITRNLSTAKAAITEIRAINAKMAFMLNVLARRSLRD